MNVIPKKLRVEPDNTAGRILIAASYAGEIPYYMPDITPICPSSWVQTRKALQAHGYITVVGKGQKKSIRLSKKGVSWLEANEPALYAHYMALTYNHHFAGGRIEHNPKARSSLETLRRHRNTKIMWMTERCGGIVRYDRLPLLISSRKVPATIPRNMICFYDSRTLKSLEKGFSSLLGFTRIAGLLVSPGGVYACYGIEQTTGIVLSAEGERKARTALTPYAMHSAEICRTLAPGSSLNQMLLFGKASVQTVLEELIGTYMYELSLKSDSEIAAYQHTARFLRSQNWKALFGLYPRCCYVPMQSGGIDALRLITTEKWKERAARIIFSKESIEKAARSSADAVIEGRKAYLLLDGDMSLLARLVYSMLNTPGQVEIYCLDVFAEDYRRVLKDLCIVKGVNMKMLCSRLNIRSQTVWVQRNNANWP